MAVKVRKPKVAEKSTSPLKRCDRCVHWHRLAIGIRGRCDKNYCSQTYAESNPKCHLTFDDDYCLKGFKSSMK